MKKNWIIFFAAVLLCYSQSFAQEEKKESFKDRLFVGGGLGASFGNTTYINVSPHVGVRITDRLSAGVGVLYQYRAYKAPTRTYSSNDFGGNVFSRFLVHRNIFLNAEYEYLSYQYYNPADIKVRTGYNSLMAGPGFVQPIGRNAAFYFLAMYNFSYSPTQLYAPYDRPWVIRMGISAGF